MQQQDGPEPVTGNGEPFHFLPMAPDVLFCKGSPTMIKVIMAAQPDLLQPASKRRQTLTNVALQFPTKKRKMLARRTIKKVVPSSSTPLDANSN